jgi:sugar-specific transcriptional regulator TrmB
MNTDKDTPEELLQQLDFSGVEAKTYLALLELEAVSVRKVAEATGVNRGTTYEAIKRLAARGLVSVRRSGQREYFSAESPEKIYDILRDKRKDLWHSQQMSQKVVPALLAKNARPQGRPIVRYFEDDEGVVAILRDVLQTCPKLKKPEYYVYSSRPLRQYIYRKFPQFTKRRIDEGIGVKVIAVGEGGEPADLSERKWLAEPDEVKISSYTIMYGDKMALISISKDYTPYGVVIEDAGTVSMQRLLFDQLWQTL